MNVIYTIILGIGLALYVIYGIMPREFAETKENAIGILVSIILTVSMLLLLDFPTEIGEYKKEEMLGLAFPTEIGEYKKEEIIIKISY